VDQSEQFYMNSSFALGSANCVAEEDIQSFVLHFMRQYISCYDGCYPCHCPMVTIIMTGNPESFRDGKTRSAIDSALKELESPAEMFTSNPEYVAARGAAQLAWYGSSSGD
jgi:hypothetical protein